MSQSKEDTLPIIWGALLISQFVYLFLPVFLDFDAEPPEQTLILALCGVGLSNAVFSFVLPSVLQNQDRLTTSIIQFALLETCSILGLVCSYLGADALYQYGLAFLGVGGMFLVFPKKEIKGRAQ